MHYEEVKTVIVTVYSDIMLNSHKNNYELCIMNCELYDKTVNFFELMN